MKNVLLVTSSPRGESSHSTRIATELAQSLEGNLIVRDLWRDRLPAIGPEFVHAIFTPEANRTPEQQIELLASDQAIAEIQNAEIIVIAAGMINFGMPAALKTWIDLISRAGVTFQYGEAGPKGLLAGKRAVLVLASGGVYSSGAMAGMDHLQPALRSNLQFLGITDIETVWIEGVAFGEDAVERALALAGERSREVAGSVR